MNARGPPRTSVPTGKIKFLKRIGALDNPKYNIKNKPVHLLAHRLIFISFPSLKFFWFFSFKKRTRNSVFLTNLLTLLLKRGGTDDTCVVAELCDTELSELYYVSAVLLCAHDGKNSVDERLSLIGDTATE